MAAAAANAIRLRRGRMVGATISGEFVLSQATMTWSAATADGFHFESNPKNTVSAFAQLGKMRNGVSSEVRFRVPPPEAGGL